MQWVLDYEHQRGWQPQDISKDRDGGLIFAVWDQLIQTGKLPVRRIEVKGRAQLHQKVSLSVNEWRPAARDSYWLYVVWAAKRWSHNC